MKRRVPDWTFRVFASFLVVAAAYHLLGIFVKINDDPPWRHALFVGVDLLFAYGLLKRPPYFSWLFLLFLGQQYFTHGGKLLRRWEQQGTVDWISLVVLVLLPVVFYFLRKDAQAQRTPSLPSARQKQGGGKSR